MNCTERKRCLALKNLKHGKSIGPDRIGNLVLQKCQPTIGKSLALIFQTFIKREIKQTYLPTGRSAYTAVAQKFLKRYYLTRSTNLAIISSARSATLQLLMFLDKVYYYNDNTIKQLAVLYIDFSKAFDKVPHSKLIGKLQNVRLGGKLFSLICSYLSEQKQMVKINKEPSSPRRVTSGVPQGSLPCYFWSSSMIYRTSYQKQYSCGYADDS